MHAHQEEAADRDGARHCQHEHYEYPGVLDLEHAHRERDRSKIEPPQVRRELVTEKLTGLDESRNVDRELTSNSCACAHIGLYRDGVLDHRIRSLELHGLHHRRTKIGMVRLRAGDA